MDAELRPLRERAHRGLRLALRDVAVRLDETALLRPGLSPAVAADTIYAIANDTTYLRFTDACGHPPERYAAWLTATLEATLLRQKRWAQPRPA